MSTTNSAWLRGPKWGLNLTQRYALFLGAVIAVLTVASLTVTSTVMRGGLRDQFRQRLEQSKLALDHYAAGRYHTRISEITTVLSSPRFIAAISSLDSATIAAEAPTYCQLLRADFMVITDARGDMAYSSMAVPRGVLAQIRGAIQRAVDSPLVSYLTVSGVVYEVCHTRIATADGMGIGAMATGMRLNASLVGDLAHLTGFDVIIYDQTSVISRSLTPLVANVLASPNAFNPLASPFNEITQLQVAGEEVLSLSVPCPRMGCAVVFVASLDEHIAPIMSKISSQLIFLGVLGAILAIAVVYFFTARRIGRQMDSLVAATTRIASGNLDFHLVPQSQDEFGALAAEIEKMRSQLRDDREKLEKAQSEQLTSERMVTIGRLATGIIHDFKNPMSIIRGSVELLERQSASDDKQTKRLKSITQQIDRMSELTSDVLEYSKGAVTLDTKSVSLVAYFAEVRENHSELYNRAGLTLEMQNTDDQILALDPRRFRRVVDNILNNAREALRPRDKVVISWETTKNGVAIIIADNGPGIPLDIAESLFDPFVTSGKESGTGLGLAIAKKIITDHGATISVETAPEAGATFRILFPKAEAISFSTTEIKGVSV